MTAIYTTLALVIGVAVLAPRPVGGRKNLTAVFGGTENEAVRSGTRWAVDILAAEGISPSKQPLVAIRELRRANRGLSLAGAKILHDQMKLAH